jgi:uncharacterized protein YkwD
MKDIKLFVTFFAILLIFGTCKKDMSWSRVYDDEILEKVNAYRTGLGLKPIENNDFMWELARVHSAAMADGSVPFGHDGVTDRYEKMRLEFGNGIPAENIDLGYGTADEVVLRWSLSLWHRENIEGDFTYTGISAVKSKDGKYYYTQLFYKKD